MRLWIGLYLPQLPLEVFCPNWSSDAAPGAGKAFATVVIEQERVVALSALARAGGVQPGLRRGGVLMLVPDARLFERAPERERDALQAVAMVLLQYSPLVAQGEESTLLIDIGASLRLFGGIGALCRHLRANLRTLGFSASLSCAPTARGAWLLARHGGARSLQMASLTRRLDRLPPNLLPPARPFAPWFEGIGCFTLAQLRRLPRPGLQRRCGRPLLDVLDAAYGMLPELFDWIEAPTTFTASLELFDRVEHAEALLAGSNRLLAQLTGWLCARQLAVLRITLLLEHERGRVACPPTPIEIVLAEATWRPEHLLRLLKERLGKVSLTAPVIGLCLQAPQVQAQAPPSESLFPEPGGSEQDQLRMFELLVARLGPENVLQAAPQADYRPELANLWVPVGQQIRAAARAAQMPPDVLSLPRPSWLLTKPIALLMRNHRPFYGSPLKMASTPERIEAGWWGQSQTRDYFIAEGLDHAHYWVYRERIVGAAADSAPRWYLHGLFG
ncbi:Y-family DNA polymerase [Massilia sp. DWR3-1-1]|uniref:Y-family DNA polymerase n=1 Tax=Massilia sp. DWR3-1-1 TaxID=2804559 RepID=UPI003CF21E5E